MGGEESFGERLRRYREAVGLTQGELAERAGVTSKAISALERGERQRPYPNTARALADALGLSAEERASFLAARAGRDEPRAPDLRPTPAPTGRPVSPAPVPGQLTSLVGREREAGVVGALLARPEVRLLTLTGPGGIGKTRLAIVVAEAAREGFPDGVHFVPLAGERDPSLVLAAIGRALEVDEGGDTASPAGLAATLGGRRALLVLDNFEQVAEAAPPLAEVLIRCPGLNTLVTSRVTLNVRGEYEYRVPPLEVPPAVEGIEFAALGGIPAVRLFVTRAAAVQPGFALTPENAGTIAAICRRLDGLPLALELAAARIALLPPAALLARLESGLGVLAGGPRDLPARQRTMRDAIAWSYDLLDPPVRAFCRRFAVCLGGVGLDTIEAVCAPAAPDEADPLALVAALTDSNLLRREAADDEARFAMLETIRAFAGEQLAAAGESDATRGRHAAHYEAVALAAGPQLNLAGQLGWLARLEREWPNVRAAVRTLLDRGEAGRVVDIAWALWRYWWVRGQRSEARRWATEALQGGAVLTPAQRGRALVLAAAMSLGMGEGATERAALDEGLGLLRAGGEARDPAVALLIAGLMAADARDVARAREALAESASLFRAAGEGWGSAFAECYQGQAALAAGDLDGAAALFAAALADGRADGDRPSIYHALHGLGLLARERGAYADATRSFAEALTLSGAMRDGVSARHFIEELSEVAVRRGDQEIADRLRAIAEAAPGTPRAGVREEPPSERLLAATTADRYVEPGRAQSRMLSLERAVEEALATFEIGER